ncbi:RhuM family protein [Haploplasma modicum]|uniref:RhuM family protein n=1 Tax=Haploplasma modicum TaxID=2150 RepID=UPI00214CC1DC|nr:RhuM family protein [Haploplasma modicum]MCR1808798.1 virulence RhuM family protein [Haploplasma modicum]
MEKEQDIIVFKDNDFSIEVNIDIEEETVWLSQNQLTNFFGTSRTNLTDHIRNIYEENELDEKSTSRLFRQVQTEGNRKVVRNILHYNLDLIISVGYRIKSKVATKFRIWSLGVIKDYMLRGYAINQNKLIQSKEQYTDFTKSVKFISELYKRKNLDKIESNSLFSVINKYSLALDTLDKYDHRLLTINNTTEDFGKNKLLYSQIMNEIRSLKEYKEGSLFGREKDKSFESSLSTIYQTAFGEELYPSVEEKAANLLYFIVKNHSFYDGNKRIAASIFVYFLDMNNILYKEDGTKLVEDNTLVALVLMIALSDPTERDVVIKIIINLINRDN